MTDQQMSATIYRGLFTDAEWDIIDEALSEYQDHLGEDEEQEQNYYSLQAKIYAIFKLTDNKWPLKIPVQSLSNLTKNWCKFTTTLTLKIL